MILDKMEHWHEYVWKSGRFARAFEFLEELSPDAADGRHAIDGDDLYCSVQTYETQPREGHEFEAHRLYADIQLLLSGEESILWAPTPGLTVTKPYEPDVETYALTADPTDLVLTPGLFCVLFPQDAHAPCTTHRVVSSVRKAVVKVRLP